MESISEMAKQNVEVLKEAVEAFREAANIDGQYAYFVSDDGCTVFEYKNVALILNTTKVNKDGTPCKVSVLIAAPSGAPGITIEFSGNDAVRVLQGFKTYLSVQWGDFE